MKKKPPPRLDRDTKLLEDKLKARKSAELENSKKTGEDWNVPDDKSLVPPEKDKKKFRKS